MTKTKFIRAMVLAAFVGGACPILAQTNNAPAPAVHPQITNAPSTKITPHQLRSFMRQKLTYSQQIVEGLTLENYSQVSTNTHKLLAMSKDNIWLKMKNQDFSAKTLQFREATSKLMDAAVAKDTPRMLEAYAMVMRDCVDCHEEFRSKQHVLLSSP